LVERIGLQVRELSPIRPSFCLSIAAYYADVNWSHRLGYLESD